MTLSLFTRLGHCSPFASPKVLVAVALEDFGIEILDLHSESVVRRFRCGALISEICFSPDGRWLCAATADVKSVFLSPPSIN